MRTFTLYIFLLFTVLFTACTNELPFDVKANPPKLVMNALMNADSLTNYVYLSLTGKDKIGKVTDASIEIRINGELKETLRPVINYENDIQCKFVVKSRFHPGDEVRIDAYTDDKQYHAWAETIVPHPIDKIEQIDTATVVLKTLYNTTACLKFKIKMSDRKNEKNFYRLIVETQNTITTNLQGRLETRYYTNQKIVTREDVVLTDGKPSTVDDEENGLFASVENKYGVFNDTRFKDASHTFTVYSLPSDVSLLFKIHQKIDIAVRILSITEKEYYYLKALNLFQSDNYDPKMSEPIKFPSNVQGGTGIVSISSEVGEIIHILEKDFELEPDSESPYTK